MVGKINYENIESRIRKELEIIKQCEVQESILVSTVGVFDEKRAETEKETIGLNKSATLKEVGRLLKKLPRNYFAFPELNQMYDKLK